MASAEVEKRYTSNPLYTQIFALTLSPYSQSSSQQAPSTNPALRNLPTNPRGIPTAPYFSALSDYGINTRSDVEPILRSFQEMISKYQFMEMNVLKRAEGLREKVPEMKGTLETVRFLKKKASTAASTAEDADDDDLDGDDEQKGSSDLKTTFSLNDTLYAHATITPSTLKEVYLWLGANVMVAYPLDEAEEMLSGRLEKAQTKLRECEEDGEFLREQITTMEVATARVYNWDVGERRKEKDLDGDGDDRKGAGRKGEGDDDEED